MTFDTTIRNLDREAYRALKAYAAWTGQTIGQALSAAIWELVDRLEPPRKTGSLADLEPVDLGPGDERLSQEVDKVAYDL